MHMRCDRKATDLEDILKLSYWLDGSQTGRHEA
jgi:hypothetical protein